METHDYLFSVLLAQCIQAQPYRCWLNAARACLLCEDLLAQPRYVEGWMVLPRPTTIEIVEHGWLMDEQHRYDPSLVLTESQQQSAWYFAGVELPQRSLAHRLHGQILPLVCHASYGPDGMGHPGYHQAYTQAWGCARELAQQRHLPETAIVLGGRVPGVETTVIALASRRR